MNDQVLPCRILVAQTDHRPLSPGASDFFNLLSVLERDTPVLTIALGVPVYSTLPAGNKVYQSHLKVDGERRRIKM